MIILSYREGLEAALVQMTGAHVMIVRVPALRMGQRQPVAKVGKLTVVARPDDEVPVVGQQAVCQEPHARHMLQGLAENALECFVIAVFVEDSQAAIAPIEHVIDIAT